MNLDSSDHLLSWVRSHYFGKYRGTVVDNQDPTNRGRIKVSVPAVTDSLELWAMPCVPYAGASVGFYCIPAVGTGVWIEYEAGDPSYPVWTGCFWGDNELPDQGGPSIKILKTEKITIRIDDDGDELVLSTTSGSKITLSTDIKIESGGATQTIGSSGISSEKGAGKVEVTDSSVKVNNGAFEVM
jgi:uncharacterized protein involved in type VI secretion and phage assembly